MDLNISHHFIFQKDKVKKKEESQNIFSSFLSFI
jgi:hypothetical protein